MNTLPRTITVQFLDDPQRFYSLRHHWRELMNSHHKHELTAKHHLLYLILLGKDWRKGFTCVTNRRKLENGAFQGWIMFRALAALHWSDPEQLLAPFDGLVTPTMLEQIRDLVPVQTASGYRPEQFTTQFPFDAYTVTATDSANA
jgi:hypothetical protein